MVSTSVRRGAAVAAAMGGALALVAGGGGVASAASTQVEFTAACDLYEFPDLNRGDVSISTSVTVDAPAVVPPKSTFTYRIQPGAMTVPKGGHSGRSTLEWTRMKYDFDIPAGVTFVSASIVPGTASGLTGVAPSVLRINESGNPDPSGAHLRISGENRTADSNNGGGNGPNLSKNSSGGMSAAAGTSFRLPAVDVTVESGAAGTKIKPMLRVTDGNSGSFNSAKNFLTFLQHEKDFAITHYWERYNCSPRDSSGAALNAGGGNLATIDVDAGVTATDTRVSAPGTAYAGDSVELKATVAPMPAGGRVQFRSNGVDLGAPVDVVNGVATARRTITETGDHDITAHYLGTAGYMESASGYVTINVTERPDGGDGGNDGGGTGSLGSLGSLSGFGS